jgi:hypothetical protein
MSIAELPPRTEQRLKCRTQFSGSLVDFPKAHCWHSAKHVGHTSLHVRSVHILGMRG